MGKTLQKGKFQYNFIRFIKKSYKEQQQQQN